MSVEWILAKWKSFQSRRSNVMMSSYDELLKEFEKLKRENMKSKIKAKDAVEYYKKKVDELSSHVNMLEGEIKVLTIMTKQRQAEDEDKKSNYVLIPSTFYLPAELTVEILSRLPVKSLLRFSAVCKTWKSLIKSDSFISKHLKQYPLNPNLSCSSLIVAGSCGDDYEIFNVTSIRFENAFDKPMKVDFPNLGYLRVLGVCDGLVCISLSQKVWDVIICNPATRHFRKIPPYKKIGDCLVWKISGFGLDPSANDYKLVSVKCNYNILSDERVHQAEIYSMSSDVWRVIDLNIPSFGSEFESLDLLSDQVFVNGVFYQAFKKKLSNKVIIVSFDLKDEVFRLVDVPQCCRSCTFNIIQMKEEVAIIVGSNEDSSFDGWLLNAVTRCWSKKFKFKLETEFRCIQFYGSTKNGDLLFGNVNDDVMPEIYSYNTMTKEVNKLPLGRHQFFLSYRYIESLLPLKKKDQVLTENLWLLCN